MHERKKNTILGLRDTDVKLKYTSCTVQKLGENIGYQ